MTAELEEQLRDIEAKMLERIAARIAAGEDSAKVMDEERAAALFQADLIDRGMRARLDALSFGPEDDA